MMDNMDMKKENPVTCLYLFIQIQASFFFFFIKCTFAASKKIQKNLELTKVSVIKKADHNNKINHKQGAGGGGGDLHTERSFQIMTPQSVTGPKTKQLILKTR